MKCRLPAACLLCAAIFGRSVVGAGAEEEPGTPPVDFSVEVMAVLSKAGCNLGTCHGNFNGKGGFRLSLRGEDPARDYLRLTHEHGERRIDRLAPDESLILLKATSQVSHQGGKRFAKDSPEYQILRQWIASGAPPGRDGSAGLARLEVTPSQAVIAQPEEAVQLQVRAEFTDGRREDVTRLAVYEPSQLSVRVEPDGRVVRESFGEVTIAVRFLQQQTSVRVAFVPARPDFVWNPPPAHHRVDALLFEKLRSLTIQAAPPADDLTFLRRVHLDVRGLLPTPEQARTFAADERPDKRERVIDELLARPEFADLWALRWSDILRNEEKVLDAKGVSLFHGWLRESMARGLPLHELVRRLVMGRGSTYENPAANYYRANRDPETRGETTARLFLGVRLQCAKCHNHPFDQWSQDDYYAWAAIFSRIDYQIVDNQRKDKFDKHEFVGEQIVLVGEAGGEVKNPRTGLNATPKLLGDRELSPSSHYERLLPLAVWLTSPENRQFAQVQANFVWYHLFGRGLVEPIDDFRATNPAANPPLLEMLADELIRHEFRLHPFARLLLTSQSYQLSSLTDDTNAGDEQNFSHAVIRRLTAEALLDTQCQVLDVPAEFVGYEPGMRAAQLPGVQKVRLREKSPSQDDRFLQTFGKPARLLACECERSNETSLTQTLTMIGGSGMQRRLTQPQNRLAVLAAATGDPAKAIDELYWAALTRPPTSDELQAAMQLIGESPDCFTGLQDLAWALLNSKEFMFRH